jgi:hypothetical protein
MPEYYKTETALAPVFLERLQAFAHLPSLGESEHNDASDVPIVIPFIL